MRKNISVSKKCTGMITDLICSRTLNMHHVKTVIIFAAMVEHHTQMSQLVPFHVASSTPSLNVGVAIGLLIPLPNDVLLLSSAQLFRAHSTATIASADSSSESSAASFSGLEDSLRICSAADRDRSLRRGCSDRCFSVACSCTK